MIRSIAEIFVMQTGAVVLAAGESTRMGKPKQLLAFRGKTIIGHLLEKIHEVGIDFVVVVTGAHHDDIAATLSSRVLIRHNENWRRGIGSSIAEGVAYLQAQKTDLWGAFVLLSDQPLVTTMHLKRLMLLQLNGDNNSDAIATEYPEGPGVPAFFSFRKFSDLMRLTGDKGAKYLLAQTFSNVKVIKPDFNLIDIDTEEDYQRLLSL